jgi:dTDP-4-dehydrorhamnose reductase
MNILVLGSSGMAGHVVSLFLREKGHSVTTVAARNALDKDTYLLDVTEIASLKDFLNCGNYDVVVNCIGVLIKQCEARKDLAVFINAYLPHFLENHYADSPTKVVHLSTDCVFSGKHAPYNESSICDGDLFYDRAKALGEIRNDKDLTFRMSIVGPEIQVSGIGLFHWFSSQTGAIRGYTSAMWNGVTTIVLAKAIDAAIKQNLTGLYHLVPDANVSKFHLLQLFKDVFNRDDIVITPCDSISLDKTLLNTRKDFDFCVPEYPEMIEEMRRWIEAHEDIYPHYRRCW